MGSSFVRTAQKNLARPKKRTDTAVDLEDRNILVEDADIWNGTGFRRGSILIEEGRIERIARSIPKSGIETIDGSGLKALPGLIDVHVHLRDMRLTHKEDFATGTAAAVANSHDLEGLAEAGAFSFKLYLPKPIAPFDVQNDQEIEKMMRAATRVETPVTVHAEDLTAAENTSKGDGFEELAEARSPIFETRAVDRLLPIQKKARCNVHYCHLTLPASLAKINANSRSTSEVAPHHLLMSKKLLSRIGWKAWMVPPLRSEQTRRSLLNSTLTGLASVIASDHAPHTIKEKDQSASKSPPGIPGLETTLPLMLTLVKRQQMNLSLLVRLLSENPARI